LELKLRAAFIAAQCVWGFCSLFSEFEMEILFPARVRFVSRAISKKFCLEYLLCPKQKEFLLFDELMVQ
jgi:hypothetical protein